MATRLERLRGRRTDKLEKSLITEEAYARLNEDDAVKYAIGAMQPIDASYTQNTFSEANRVRDQLADGLQKRGLTPGFEYQGSVTSDTHIRVHSDIDLIALHNKFHTLEPPLQPLIPYNGNPLDDLRRLREDSCAILGSAFPQATVDKSRGKAIGISGGSLRRKVDIIAANWYTTTEYQQNQNAVFRAVQVYDAASNTRLVNKPFLHNDRINQRDIRLRGNLRKTIRLLKSLKYDAESGVRMSSYDIASIAYSMPDQLLTVEPAQSLRLLASADQFLRVLQASAPVRSALRVPNETRPIFGPDGASLEGLNELQGETARLLNEIASGLARSFRKLEEARIELPSNR